MSERLVYAGGAGEGGKGLTEERENAETIHWSLYSTILRSRPMVGRAMPAAVEFAVCIGQGICMKGNVSGHSTYVYHHRKGAGRDKRDGFA